MASEMNKERDITHFFTPSLGATPFFSFDG